MTYDQYQQLYSAAKAQIAARVAKIQPTAGNGASVNGMGIAIEVPAAEEAGAVDLTQYYILSWLGEAGSFASASEIDVGQFGEVDASFNFDMGAQDPFLPLNPALVQPLVLTLQFVGEKSGIYSYYFPVRVTLVQYATNVSPDQIITEEPLRTVNVDLRREPVTTTFYYDFTDYRPQIVRLTNLVKI